MRKLLFFILLAQPGYADECLDEILFHAQQDERLLPAVEAIRGHWENFRLSYRFTALSAMGGVSIAPSLEELSADDSMETCLAYGLRQCFRIAVQRELDESYYGPFSNARFLSQLTGESPSEGMVLLAFPDESAGGRLAQVLRTDPELQSLPRLALANERQPASERWLDALTRIQYADQWQNPLVDIRPSKKRLRIHFFGTVRRDGLRRVGMWLEKLLETSEAQEIVLVIREPWLWREATSGTRTAVTLISGAGEFPWVFDGLKQWGGSSPPGVDFRKGTYRFDLTYPQGRRVILEWHTASSSL